MKKLNLIPLCIMLCMCLATIAFGYTADLYDEDGTTFIKSVSFQKGETTSLPEQQNSESRYFLGYKTADGKQLHRYNIHTEYEGDLVLSASYLDRYQMVPGKNVVKNGTFDENYINVTPSNGTLTIVSEKDGNRVLEYSRGSAYASIQHFMKWETGRKYRVSYRFMIPDAQLVKCTVNARYFESQAEVDSSAAADNSKGSKTGTAGVWTSHSVDFEIPATCISHHKRDALSLYCEPTYPEGSADRNGIVYYDDLQIIPYHKITYNANGGTLTSGETAYWLNGTYTVDSSIVPAREGYTFLGWGRSENSSVSVSEIELCGEDVTLYARWQDAENQPIFTYSFANETKGIADGAMSIVAKNEAKDYTSVTIYYADDNGILENYTPLKTLEIVQGVATYGVSGKRSFPREATKLHLVFSADGKDDFTYIYEIPEEKRIIGEKTPVVSFYSVSDAHNAVNDYDLDGRVVTFNRNNAFNDMVANKDSYDFVMLNGDSVCHSTEGDYAKFDAFRQKFNENGIPLFFGVGNHEFHVPRTDGEKPELAAGNEEIFLTLLDAQEQYLEANGYRLDRAPDDWYYSFEINGIKFITCATPYPNYIRDSADYEISGEQLVWLENQLFDAEKSNKPVFVFSHVGIAKYIPPYSTSGITNVNELEEVLNRHANLFFGTAHSHTNINDDWHTVAAGDQKTQYTHYNEGSLAYTYEYLEDGTRNYETDYCIGYFIEIYDDMVVFKGRKFDDEEDGGSKFISHAQYQIMIPAADKELPTLTLSGELADGSVITPVLSSSYESGIASYQWYVNSKVVSDNETYKVAVTEDTCGKRIALRIIFEDGTYVSAITDEVPGYKVTFDYNGGKGSVEMADQNVVPNTAFTPNLPTVAPTMENHYFAGWSVNKDASEPDESFFAAESMTLYAVWKEGYTISYDANGGTGSVPASHVVPKGNAAPHATQPYPKLDGKYFVGWADTRDASEPMASVNVKSDLTLYAVYTDEPKWYFDANASAFTPGGAVTSYGIKDGRLYYENKHSANNDVVFENKATSFSAEAYPYVRVKLYAENAGGTPVTNIFNSIFFKSPTSGYDGSKTRISLAASSIVATVDGMSIIERYIPELSTAKEDYKGSITMVRFDPIESLGATGYTDYLVFTDKKGIYKADVTVSEDGGVTLSDETVNCTASAVWNETILGKTVTVTLTPNEGYEFTTREDVMALTAINGEKPDGAVVLADGSAKIWKGDKGAVEFGTFEEGSVAASINVNSEASGNDIVVAVYSEGTLCGLKIFHDAVIDTGVIDVKVSAALNADTVKVYVFDTFDAMTPIMEPSSAILK